MKCRIYIYILIIIIKVDPPFIDSISKYFSVKNMKLKRSASIIKIQPKYPQNFLMNMPNSVEQPEIMIHPPIHSNSSTFHQNFYYDTTENRNYGSEQEMNKSQRNSIKDYESPDFVQRNSKPNALSNFSIGETRGSFNKPCETTQEEIKNVSFITKLTDKIYVFYKDQPKSSIIEQPKHSIIEKGPSKNSIKEEINEKEGIKNMRSSIKEGSILKMKEDNANLIKERNRSNSKVSFCLEEITEDRKSKAKLSLLPHNNSKQELKENKESMEKIPENDTVISEEM